MQVVCVCVCDCVCVCVRACVCVCVNVRYNTTIHAWIGECVGVDNVFGRSRVSEETREASSGFLRVWVVHNNT